MSHAASGAHAYDIFISCKTTHCAWVETLSRNLTACGFRVFLDQWALIIMLKKEAEAIFGKDRGLHLYPPNSVRADALAYFEGLFVQSNLADKYVEIVG